MGSASVHECQVGSQPRGGYNNHTFDWFTNQIRNLSFPFPSHLDIFRSILWGHGRLNDRFELHYFASVTERG